MKHCIATILFLVVSQLASSQSSSSHFIPSLSPRMVAEWEPANGVLFAWPLSLPHKLIQEFAKDTKLYVLVDSDSSMQEAIRWFSDWNINSLNVKYIQSPHGIDVSWTRDWGPHAVFYPNQPMKLADGKYLYATPVIGMECDTIKWFLYKNKDGTIEQTIIDDAIPEYIAKELNIGIEYLPFAFTGGNVISDGQQTAFSTCALTTENKYMGITDSAFFSSAQKMLGIDQYHILSNFEMNGIQHIDCLMKLLDDERILVMKPPADHPLFAQYEKIVHEELATLINPYGRRYQIIRLDTERYFKDKLAAYTNSLILNKCIYVPLFGIRQDSLALKQWADAMPGYKVKGFEFKLKDEPILSPLSKKIYSGMGWTDGDALHCRTRAIWNPNMIYISVDRVPVRVNNGIEISSIIKNYGEGELNSPELIWREKNKTKWRKTRMVKSSTQDLFIARLKRKSSELEYYVKVSSTKGNTFRMPITGPEGFYKYSFANH